MVNNCFLLLKIQLLNLFGINKLLHAAEPKEKRKAVFLLIGGVLLGLMIAIYSAGMAIGYVMLDMTELIPSFMLTVTALVTLFTGMLKTNGVFFSTRDYDMVMALPIKSGVIAVSRFLFLYCMNAVFSALIIIPFGLVYLLIASSGAMSYFMLLLVVLLAPLLPMVAATLLGCLITAVSVRFRYKNIANIILGMAATIAIMLFSFNINQLSLGDVKAAGTLIASFYPPAVLVSQGFGGNRISFLLFVVLSIVAFLLFVAVFTKYYQKIHSLLLGSQSKKAYRLDEMKQSGILMAFYKKELRGYFSCPIYVMNTLIGAVLLLLMGISTLIIDFKTLELGELLPTMTSYGPLIASAVIVLGSTTASSISLEGKCRWIVFSAPVPAQTIYQSKIAVNLTIFLPAALVGGSLLAIGLKVDFLDAFLMILIPIIYSLFISVLGLTVNLKYPQYDWTNEVTVVKQSFSVMITLLLGIVSIAVPAALTWLMSPILEEQISLSVFAILLLGVTLVIYKKLQKNKLCD